MGLSCKGACRHHRAPEIPGGRTGTMRELRKKHPHLARCRHCSLYIVWDGRNCPCCGGPLRVKARASKSRQASDDHVHRESP